MLSVFASPSRYVQGRDATRFLGEEMKKMGLTGRAFIVAGRAASVSLRQSWDLTFAEAGIEFSVYKFGGECSLKEIEEAKRLAQDYRAAVIIGAGGGKVLDTARAVAASLELPVVNCPTAASSDAPCSALSVVYTPDGEFEKYIFYKRNPELVLVDTTVIAAAPPRLLVAGMGDALATWFEAKTVIDASKANQLGGASTESASALAQLCYQILLKDGPAALQSAKLKVVTPALERLVEANTLLSGLGFESGGLAVAHSVHNGLTTIDSTHEYLHGEKVAFGLIVQLVLEGKPQVLIDEVLRFSTAVGLPTTLKAVGIAQPSTRIIDRIAQRAVAPGETAHNEPFVVTAEAVADAIVAADALGTDWSRQCFQREATLASS